MLLAFFVKESTVTMEPKTEAISQLTYRCPACDASIDIVTTLVGETVECPHCSTPFLAEEPSAKPMMEKDPQAMHVDAEYTITRPSDDESTLVELHPAMFRRHPFLYLALVGLAIASAIFGVMASIDQNWTLAAICLGVLVLSAGYLIYWYVEIIATTLQVTNKRTTLRKGILSKSTTEVQHDDVRNLQVHQNVIQRILGIGDIAISSSGQDDLELFVKAIPAPEEVAELVRRLQ